MRILNLILPLMIALGSCSSDASPSWTGEAPTPDAALALKSDYLASRPDDAAAQFELGLTEALRAVEAVYQYRYKHYSGELPLTPGGQMNLPVSPDAKFDPAFLENAMIDALKHLGRAEKALSKASGKEFAVELDPKDFWFDIDEDGKRSDIESLTTYLPGILGNRQMQRSDASDIGTIRFDTADADWLLAYVHTMSGMAEIVLAVDTKTALTQVYNGRQALIDNDRVPANVMGLDREIDSIAAVLLTLRGTPDANRTRKAHKHFLSMINSNRDFWTRVEQEQDDEREWLPNGSQTSVFGTQVSPDMAENWQGVLNEVEGALKGEKLVPFWRLSGRDNRETYGINMDKFFNDPPDLDIVLMIQGGSFAPYIEQGELIDNSAWRQFSRMTGGQAGLFALWFN